MILVGEIRDAETAKTAVHASMTGHLVLSTLHANDAVAALSRLAELGIDRRVAASVILGVVAQRLVRLNCPSCTSERILQSRCTWIAWAYPDPKREGFVKVLAVPSAVSRAAKGARGSSNCSK